MRRGCQLVAGRGFVQGTPRQRSSNKVALHSVGDTVAAMPGTSPCLCPQPLRNGRVTSFPLKPQATMVRGSALLRPGPRREMRREPPRAGGLGGLVLPASRRGHEKQELPGPHSVVHGEPAFRSARPASAPPSPRAQPPGRSLSGTGDPTVPPPPAARSGVTHGPLTPAPGRTQKAQQRHGGQRGPLLSSHPPRTTGSGPKETRSPAE